MKAIIFVLMASYALFVQAHEEELETIQVKDHSGTSKLVDFAPSAITLKGKDLRKKRQTSIGDTLQNEAGVASTSFGPNASRPVIRGMDGARIKFLQNGLGTLDASTQSLDHAIPIDPLLVDQIEIIRGPMSLLYGSSTVGGVVNVVTNRTHNTYQEGLVTEFQTQGESVNNGLSNSAKLDYGKNNWVLHFDGSTKNLQDVKIPKYARSNRLRRSSPVANEPKNKLPNSFNKQDSLGTGVTKIFNRGFLGLSFGHFSNDYGVVAERDVAIKMVQNRFELHGEYRLKSSWFELVRVRSAQSDYQHKEIERSVTGTIFKNLGNETRVELVNKKGGLHGVSGVQSQIFDFKAQGDEAFLPGVHNQITSLFTFQEHHFNNSSVNAGLRLEDSRINKKSTQNFGAGKDFGFFGLNGALGYTYNLTKENSLSATYSYTERAPNFQELLSNGAHLATGSFELGKDNLAKEKSQSMEVNFKRASKLQMIKASLYRQRFENFITLRPTGTNDGTSGLPIFAYSQVPALFYGFDLDTRHQLAEAEKGVLNLLMKFDYVFARDLHNNDYLPRISPPRITSGLEFVSNSWTHDLDVQYVFEQNRTSRNESASDRYILTSLGSQYSFITETSKLDVFLRIRNLFDVEARSHVSILKDIAPLPGRNIILGLNWLI